VSQARRVTEVHPRERRAGKSTAVVVALMTWYGLRGRDLLIRDEQTPHARVVPGRVGASGYGAWLVARF